jgi:hypothetical protein
VAVQVEAAVPEHEYVLQSPYLVEPFSFGRTPQATSAVEIILAPLIISAHRVNIQNRDAFAVGFQSLSFEVIALLY